MTLLERRHLSPQTGTGLAVRRGQLLRITDPEGEQVSDLMSFALDDTQLRQFLQTAQQYMGPQ